MTTEGFEIPSELAVLNPETQKKIVPIGNKAYNLYPLAEGMCEKLSIEIQEILRTIFTQDCQCADCKKIYKDSLGKLEKCECGGSLASLQKTPASVLLGGKVPKILAEVLGLPEKYIQENATLAQLKHLAAVLWSQNFDDEVTMPEDSKKNFQRFLEWTGILPKLQGSMKSRESDSASEGSTKSSPINTDGKESMSKEGG